MENLLKFLYKIGNHASDPDRATYIRKADSCPVARMATKQSDTPSPISQIVNALLRHMEHKSAAEHLRKSQSEYDISNILYNNCHLASLSSKVANASGNDMHRNPMPLTDDGRLAGNPFHLHIYRAPARRVPRPSSTRRRPVRSRPCGNRITAARAIGSVPITVVGRRPTRRGRLGRLLS
jgi:hypothetical protein